MNPKIKSVDELLEKKEILKDYKTALMSRQMSLLGRKEVLNGKAKFGIFGDGKEIAQIVMARFFQPGDWRSGYYRDQSFMFAKGLCEYSQFFAQLYADTNPEREPQSAGRQMNCHFSTHLIDKKGNWLDQTSRYNSTSDISPTGGQMSRLLGLAYASKLYRNSPHLKEEELIKRYSRKGSEIAFGTIGNASTSEGVFWETVNAAGVLQVPMLISIWDDDYGISVPNKLQTTKGNISEVLAGFADTEEKIGFKIYTVPGYDYEALYHTYHEATSTCRKLHRPTIIHVTHMTQPQGHSTSGSHERYKSKDRLAYENSIDCITSFRKWIESKNLATSKDLDLLESQCIEEAEKIKEEAWHQFQAPIHLEKEEALDVLTKINEEIKSKEIEKNIRDLNYQTTPMRRNIAQALRQSSLHLRGKQHSSIQKELENYQNKYQKKNQEIYSSHLYSQTNGALQVKGIDKIYTEQSKKWDARQIIQKYFNQAISHDPRIFIIGEDVGQLGGVNLEFEGLTEKYGDLVVTDTGIREATILGQGIGAALRGLKPIVDIQYLDYLVYCLQGLTDDLATLQYRTKGTQTSPVIIRTKGHRLEGVWHTGSPISMLLGALRGIHLCVPRDAVQAVGLYQTLLQADDPGLVIEVLNGYRIKELCPSNLGEYQIPLGVPEVLIKGEHITLVTYGANVRIAFQACQILEKMNISVELIDVQTLLPFDRYHHIRASIEKTNAVLFLDEDVPGGGTAFMMQKVLEEQNAYDFLDSPPSTLCAREHRGAYASDGDYYSKPNQEDIIEKIYSMMHERYPTFYPLT